MSVTYLTIALVIGYLMIIKILAYLAHLKSDRTVEYFFIDGRNTGQFAAVAKVFSTATRNIVTYEQLLFLLALFTGIYITKN